MEEIAHILMVYFFPFQLVIGLVGNALNLLVLLNRQMRSRTNTLLAAVAFADIFFFFFMLTYNFKYFKYLRRSEPLGSLIQYANPHITGLVNMCAFASTWFLVAVCFERLLAVRWPLKARTFWGDRGRPSSIILVVCVFALIITLHSHITQEVRRVEVNGKSVLRVSVRESMMGYWRVATIIHAVLQVFIPVILVALTSLLMADALFAFLPSTKRRRRKEEELLQATTDNLHPPPTPTGRRQNSSISSNPGQGLLSLAQQQQLLQQRIKPSHQSTAQKRATYTVLIIAVAFALFQLPSTIIYIWELLTPEAANSLAFITLGTVANSLVVSGKMANFFLFCMSSVHFRRNLKRVLCAKCSGGKPSIPNFSSNNQHRRESGENAKMSVDGRPQMRLGSLGETCPSKHSGTHQKLSLLENGAVPDASTRKHHSFDASFQNSQERVGV